MIIEAYLIINNRGGIRAVKQRPALNNDEIALNLNVDVPEVFFERLIPTVNIAIPEGAMIKPDIDTSVQLISQKVGEALKIDSTVVMDGLKEMMREEVENKRGGSGFGPGEIVMPLRGGGSGNDNENGGGGGQ